MAIIIHSLTLGALATNCYILASDKTDECLIVDPAADGDTINNLILQNQYQPQAIILTHGHFDHVLGLLEVKLAWQIPVYLHQQDNFLLQKAAASAKHWLGEKVDPIPPADLPLSSDNEFILDTETISVLETPGHTPGSICLQSKNYLLTGDTLFAEEVGRTDLSYSNSKQLHNSIANISQLPNSVTILPGHGQPENLGNVKNMWLNNWLQSS